MPLRGEMVEPEVGHELGGLMLSCVRVEDPMLLLRAARWRNTLSEVGLAIPLWAVHDLGLLAIVDPASVPIGPRPSLGGITRTPAEARSHAQYVETLAEVATTEMLEKARQWKLSDELLIIVLMKVLGPLYERFRSDSRARPKPAAKLPLDPDLYQSLEHELPPLWERTSRVKDLGFLAHIAEQRLRLVTAIEQVDLDTLRLLGMFGTEAGAASALRMLDLLAVFESPEANDVVNFSLDLIPSVLETKKASGSQTFSVDGYSGMTRRGSLDSLVLSELAYGPEVFARRFAENEVYYYARERQREQERRLHYIVVDASASMRGKRSVFARGLALTLVKKLLLRGEDVYLRFFDARLYEVQQATRGRSGRRDINVPYVLSFKGERGRNYAKVFTLLGTELERLARREGQQPVLYLLTHAECHAPVEVVERLKRSASLYGIFMLPSKGVLELDYLHLLDTVQVVDEAALNKRDERAKLALGILEDAAGEEAKR